MSINYRVGERVRRVKGADDGNYNYVFGAPIGSLGTVTAGTNPDIQQHRRYPAIVSWNEGDGGRVMCADEIERVHEDL